MKPKVIITILVCIFVIVTLLLLLNNKNTNVIDDNKSGEMMKTTKDIKSIYLSALDDDIKNGFTKIEKENVNSSNGIIVEAITFKDESNDSGEKTLVNIYIQNDSDNPISKNESFTISLFDQSNRLIHKFGGVVEAASDIKPGSMTIVKTQFLSSAGNIVSAEVEFDISKEL